MSKKDNESNREENNTMVEVEEMFALTISSLRKTVEGNPTQEGLSRGGSSSLPLSGRPGSQLAGDEITCSDVRSHMLAMLRVVTNEDLSQPDSDVDVSGEMLASMNSAVKSVTWEQVKLTVAKDTDMLELVNWIEGGCLGTKGDLTEAVQEYWGVKDELSVSEGVPLYDERTKASCTYNAPLCTSGRDRHDA